MGIYTEVSITTYTITPDPVGCVLRYDLVCALPTDCPAGKGPSNIVIQLPFSAPGFQVWTNDQSNIGTYIMTYRAWVVGFENIVIQGGNTKMTIRAPNTSQQKEYTLSISCTNPSWPAQTYVIGSAPIILNVPSPCTGSGSGHVLVPFYKIKSPESGFVTITGNPPSSDPEKIQIYTTNAAYLQATPYTVTVYATDAYANVSQTFTFQLTVTCLVNTVDMTSAAISSFTYFYSTATSNTPFPTYFVNPNCGNRPITYSLQMQAGGTVPSAFSINTTTLQFVITQNVFIAVGTYNLKLVATETWSSSSPKSNSACLWTVTIRCTTSINVQTNSIPASTTYILNPNSLNTQTLTAPTYVPVPAVCTLGPVLSIVNTATWTCPSWITCAPTAGGTISIATMDWTLAGTYNFRINLSDTQSTVTNTSVLFAIIIRIMNATSITVATTVANQTYLVSAAALIVDPPTYTWYPTQSSTAFTYAIQSGPSFVTIAGSPQKINIYTTLSSNTGTYTVTVRSTETNSGLFNDQSFTLLVKCVSAIAPSSSLSAVTYFITDPAITRTPAYTLTPADCPYELVLTVTLADNSPLPASITYASPTISVSTADYAATGTYSVKIVATDPKTGITNSALTLSVVIKCTKNLLVSANPIPASTTYILNPNSLNTVSLTMPTYARNPTGCTFTPSYAVTNIATGTCPSWITCAPSHGGNISIGTTDWTLENTYNFRITLTDAFSGLTDATVTFTVIIKIMDATSITMATTISNQTYLVSSTAISLSVPTYTWFPTQSHTVFTSTKTAGPSFVSISGPPQKVNIYTTLSSDTGVYTVTVRTTETNSGLFNDQSFTLLVKCVSAIAPQTLTDVTYFITDPAITRNPLYTLTPADCPYELVLTVTLADNSPLPASITYTSPTISVSTADYAATGTYSVKIVATDPKTGITNSALTLSVVIKCTKSIDLISGAITSFSYQIVLATPNNVVKPLPIYDVNPSQCAKGLFTYELVYSGTFPSFVNQFPTTDVLIMTQDVSKVGAYSLYIKVTEPITGLTNVLDTFVLTVLAPNYATNLAWTVSNPIADHNYLVSSADPLIVTPAFIVIPADADVHYTYTLSSSPAFITLTAANPKEISIFTTDTAKTGIYTVTYTLAEVFSGRSISDTFVVTVSCVQTIQQLSSVAPVTYYIQDPVIPINIPAYTLSPGSCPYELTVASVTLSNGNPLPNAIIFNGVNTVNVQENAFAATGVYTVEVTVIDPKTGITNSDLLFSVTVKCTKSITVMSNVIPAVTVYTINQSVLKTTSLTVPTYGPILSGCLVGTWSFSVALDPVATFPPFISETPTSTISIATTNNAEAGTYNFRITATDSLTGLQNNSVVFQVQMLAITAINLSVPTAIPNQIYRVSDTAILLNVPQYLVTPSAATTKYTYTLVAPTPAFVTRVGSGDQTSQVQIVTTNHLDTGTYTVTVETYEEYSQITNTQSFSLLVQCVHSILTTSTIANQIYYIGDALVSLPVPSYALTPGACPVELDYDVKQLGGAALPNAITVDQSTFGSESIKIYETDQNVAAIYTIQVKAIDRKTLVASNVITFTVTVRLRATDLVLVAGTNVNDQNYLVSNPTMILAVPEYTFVPAHANTQCYHQLGANTPAFVTLVGNPYGSPTIQVSTTSGLHTGTYTIDVIFTDEFSLISKTDQFVLVISCVRTITPNPQTNVVYWITDAAIIKYPTYVLTPADCPNELVYSVTLTDLSPLPASIVFDATPGTETITVSETDYLATGVYTVAVKVIDPKTTLQNTALSFVVDVRCTKTIDLISGQINSISYEIDLDQPWTLDTPLPVYQQNPSQCAVGTISRTLVRTDGSAVTFIAQNPIDNIRVATQIVPNVGTYNYKVVATDSLTGLVNQANTFPIHITPPTIATDFILDVGTEIAAQNYLVGSGTRILSVPTYTVVPADADLSISYSTTSTPAAGFISAIEQTPGVWKVQIVTASTADTGIYTVTLSFTDAYSTLVRQTTFVVTISCVQVIDQLSTVPSTTYFISDPLIDIPIPLYSLTPGTCPYELMYSAALVDASPLPAAITLQNAATHFLRVYETNWLLTGVYQVRITVTDPKTGLTNNSLLIDVIVKCTKLISVVTNPIPGTTIYTINKSVLQTHSLSVPTYEPTPNTCQFGTWSLSVALDPVATFPPFITQSPLPTGTIDIASTDTTQTGTYNFRITATDSLTGLQNNNIVFQVQMLSITAIDLNVPTAIPNQIYRVLLPATILTVPQYLVTPTAASTKYSYSLIAPTPSFVTLLGSGDQSSQVQIVTSDYSNTATYTVTVQTYEEYSQITKLQSFQLVVSCIQQLITATFIPNKIYYIGDPQISFAVPTYSLIPSSCPKELKYSVMRADSTALPSCIWLDDATLNSETIKVFEASVNAATVYSIQVFATDEKTGVQSDVTYFTVTVRLRATGLNIVSGTEIPDVNYLVGSPLVTLNVAEYTIFPSNANVDCHHTMGATTPTFINLVLNVAGDTITIQTTNTADTGIYTINVIYTDLFSGLSQTDTFVVTVSCVRSITQSTLISPVTYFITDPTIPVVLPIYTISPASCPYELFVLIVEQQNGSALPNAISFDGVNTVNVQENTYASTGVYMVKVTVKDPKSMLQNFEQVFQVIVKCTKSIDLVTTGLPATSSFEIDSKFLNTLALTQPTFTPNPPQCTIGTYTYQLANNIGSVISVPGFIPTFTNTQLVVATTNIAFEGTYDFSIKVTESISGLTNNDVHFQFVLTVKIYATQMNLITSTVIPDQNYLMGSTTMSLLAYQYSWVPVNSVLDVVYELLNPPSFVTINPIAGPWVEVFTSDPADTGIYTIFVKTTDNQSELTQTHSFTLTVSCVQTITITAPLPDVTYYITDSAILRYPTFVLWPVGCPNELIYVVTQSNNSPLPGTVVFTDTPGDPIISVHEMNYALTAQYSVKVLVTDPKTGRQNSDYLLAITVLCTKTIEIASDQVFNFSYKIDLDAPWILTKPAPKYKPNPIQCAVGTYSLEVIYLDSVSFPPFITHIPTTSLFIATQDVSTVGLHNFKIKATESISTWFNDADVFVLEIIAPTYTAALVLVSGTAIADFTYTIGSGPVVKPCPSYTVLPVDADKQFVYTLHALTPAFVTLIPNPNPSLPPTLQVLSSSNLDLGVYSISVITTEFWSNVQTTQIFTLTVACVTHIDNYATMFPQLYFISDPAIDATIPLYSLTPSTCPYELVYSATLVDNSALPAAITLQENAGTHFLRISEADPAKTGVYKVKVTVLDAKSALSHSAITVDVTIKCTKSITLLTDVIVDIYRLNEIDPAQLYTYAMPTYDVFPTFCLHSPIELTIKQTNVPLGTPLPSFISYSQLQVNLSTSDALGVNAFYFQVTAYEPVSLLSNTEVLFNVISANSVVATKITVNAATLIPDQVYRIGDSAKLVKTPSYGKFPSYVAVDYYYSILTPHQFISVVIDPVLGPCVKLSSSNPLDYGFYPIDLEVTESYSGLKHTTSFNVQITCVRSIIPTTTVSALTYYVYDPTSVVILPLIQLDPLLCPNVLDYSLTMQNGSSVQGSFVLDATVGSEKVNVFELDPLLTGVFPLRVVLTDPTTGVKANINFTATIKCTKSITMTFNPLTAPFHYNVGTLSLNTTQLDLPAYEPNPPTCQVGTFTFQLTYINNPSSFPNFIDHNPTGKIIVGTQDTSHLGPNSFRILATDTLTGLSNNEVEFMVNLYCQTTGMTVFLEAFKNPIPFTPGLEAPKTKEIPLYGFEPARCIEPYTTEIIPEFWTPDGKAPDWITLSADQRSFTVYTADKSLSGKFPLHFKTQIAKYNVTNEELKFVINFDCIVLEIKSEPFISSYTYYIDPELTQLKYLPLPTFIGEPTYCPQVFTYLVESNSAAVTASRFVTIVDDQFVFDTKDLSCMGTFELRVQATEPRHGAQGTVFFQVILDCKVTSVFNKPVDSSSRYFYTVGEPMLIIPMPAYYLLPTGCIKPLLFGLFNSEIDGQILLPPKSLTLPSFVKFVPEKERVEIYGTDMDEGMHQYKFFISAKEVQFNIIDKNEYTFTVDVSISNTAPYFESTLSSLTLTEEDLTLQTTSKSSVIQLPRVMDKENNQVSLFQVQMGKANEFLKFDLATKRFNVDRAKAMLADPGDYQILITMADQYGAISTSSFTISLRPEDSQYIGKLPPAPKTDILRVDGQTYSAKSVDFQTGQVTQTDLDQITQQLENESLIDRESKADSRSFTAKLGKVDMGGFFEVRFSDETLEVLKDVVQEKNAVQVKVVWVNEKIVIGQEDVPEYQVKLLAVSRLGISFQIMFTDPYLVSRGLSPDFVEVNFKNPAFFLRASDQAMLHPSSRILVGPIPKQIETSLAKPQAVSQTKSASQNAQTVLASTMVVSTFTGLSAASMWGAFNTMQLISLQQYTDIDMPSNADAVFSDLDSKFRGGPLNPSQWFQHVLVDKQATVDPPIVKRQLQLLTEKQERERTQQKIFDEYVPKSPMTEAGFFVLVMICCLFMSGLVAVATYFLKRAGWYGAVAVDYVCKPLERLFTFSLLIQAEQFGYVYLVLAGIQEKVFLRNLVAYGNNLQMFGKVLYYFAFAYVTIYPVSVFFFFLLVGSKGLQNKTAKKYIGSLYSGIDTSRAVHGQYVTLFLMRRACIGIAISFFRQHYFVQLEIYLLTSYACLVFLCLMRPYKSAHHNVIEICNEILVIFSVYIMHGLCLYIPSRDWKYQMGWIYIGVLVVVFVLNFTMIVGHLCAFAARKLKQFYTNRLLRSKISLSAVHPFKEIVTKKAQRKSVIPQSSQKTLNARLESQLPMIPEEYEFEEESQIHRQKNHTRAVNSTLEVSRNVPDTRSVTGHSISANDDELPEEKAENRSTSKPLTFKSLQEMNQSRKDGRVDMMTPRMQVESLDSSSDKDQTDSDPRLNLFGDAIQKFEAEVRIVRKSIQKGERIDWEQTPLENKRPSAESGGWTEKESELHIPIQQQPAIGSKNTDASPWEQMVRKLEKELVTPVHVSEMRQLPDEVPEYSTVGDQEMMIKDETSKSKRSFMKTAHPKNRRHTAIEKSQEFTPARTSNAFKPQVVSESSALEEELKLYDPSRKREVVEQNRFTCRTEIDRAYNPVQFNNDYHRDSESRIVSVDQSEKSNQPEPAMMDNFMTESNIPLPPNFATNIETISEASRASFMRGNRFKKSHLQDEMSLFDQSRFGKQTQPIQIKDHQEENKDIGKHIQMRTEESDDRRFKKIDSLEQTQHKKPDRVATDVNLNRDNFKRMVEKSLKSKSVRGTINNLKQNLERIKESTDQIINIIQPLNQEAQSERPATFEVSQQRFESNQSEGMMVQDEYRTGEKKNRNQSRLQRVKQILSGEKLRYTPHEELYYKLGNQQYVAERTQALLAGRARSQDYLDPQFNIAELFSSEDENKVDAFNASRMRQEIQSRSLDEQLHGKSSVNKSVEYQGMHKKPNKMRQLVSDNAKVLQGTAQIFVPKKIQLSQKSKKSLKILQKQQLRLEDSFRAFEGALQSAQKTSILMKDEAQSSSDSFSSKRKQLKVKKDSHSSQIMAEMKLFEKSLKPQPVPKHKGMNTQIATPEPPVENRHSQLQNEMKLFAEQPEAVPKHRGMDTQFQTEHTLD